MIFEYKDKDGTPLYKVSINIRGRRDSRRRYRRVICGIQSLEEALKEEKKLRRIVENRMHERESIGDRLGTLITRWANHSIATKVATGEIGYKLIVDYQGTLEKWLKPYLHKPAFQLSSFIVSEVVRQKKLEGISLSQLTKFRRMIRMIFEFGITYGIVPPGTPIPTSDIKIKSKEEKAPEILSYTEMRKLIELAVQYKHPWRHIWAFALLTGMRSGELYALEWKDVDLENRLVRVSKSYQVMTRVIKSTKAGYWRDIPISDELMRVLEELRPTTGATPHVLPRLHEWSTGCQAVVIREFCAQHSIPSIRFHTLRACFATQLLRNGVEAAKVMKVCGWKDLSTMQRYVRLAGIEVTGVTDKISVLPSIDPSAKVVSIRGV